MDIRNSKENSTVLPIESQTVFISVNNRCALSLYSHFYVSIWGMQNMWGKNVDKILYINDKCHINTLYNLFCYPSYK
jgi:hypothetical protein